MKKEILLLCMAAVILTACGSSQSKKFMGLKGRVESVKDFRYEAIDKFGEIEPGDLYEVYVYTFNRDGHLVKYGVYNDDGDCEWRQENTYKGEECISVTEYDRYGDTISIQNLIEVKGNIRIWEISGGGLVRCECVDSEKYRCFTFKDGSETVMVKVESWFNDNGDCIENKTTEGTEIIHWTKSKFQNGNEVKKEYLTSGGGKTVTYSYGDYDTTGNWTKQIVYYNGVAECIVKREIKYTK